MTAPWVERWWRGLDRPGWHLFILAMVALAVALALALYSAVAAQQGRIGAVAATALASLALAGWVAIRIVPVLARRTALRWFAYQIDYRLTREGVIYLGLVFVLVFAALNTGNNLLFLILSCLLAGILVSGVLSRIVLSGVELRLELPDHIFAEQPVLAALELRNEKQALPSFSLHVAGSKKETDRQIFSRPLYFPHLARQSAARQKIELTFPKRGVYRQDAFTISTRFPFGFLEKARRVRSEMEVVVYPPVEPTDEFYEILPLLSGELESFHRGRGHDLYSIRDYQPTDSARFVDWKATARTGALKVREFTREDERRVILVLDPFVHPGGGLGGRELEAKFERAVSLCACLAWHFYEINAVLQFRAGPRATAMAPAAEIVYDILRELAFVEPQPPEGDGEFLLRLTDEPDLFKIVLTGRPRGSIPTGLWTSSYMIFFELL